MGWIGLDPENWIHVQIWYVSHYHLVNFRHTWLLYINGISEDQKPIVKISGGEFAHPGTLPGIITGFWCGEGSNFSLFH